MLTERGKEFLVEYEMKSGVEISRERTFKGVRIMLIGKFQLLFQLCFYILLLGKEKVGKTSFRKRIVSLSNPQKNNLAVKEIINQKKEERMTHGVGKSNNMQIQIKIINNK